MRQDLRYAARVLLQGKGWTVVVVLSLALGIGANIALFSAVNGLVFRKLPVKDPDTLVRLRNVGRNNMANSTSDYGVRAQEGGLDARATFSFPMFQQLRRENRTMTDMVAGAPMANVNVVVDGQAEIASGYVASGNFHGLLGIGTVLGRTMTPSDDDAAASPVAVLSHSYWTRRFGRSPDVLGKVLIANNTPVTVVGVTAPEFTGIQRPIGTAPDLTFPLSFDTVINSAQADPGMPPRLTQPTYWWLQVMGRLKPGATLQQVEGNLAEVFRHEARAGMDAFLATLPPAERDTSPNRNRSEVPHLSASWGGQGIYDNSPTELRSVTILSVVVALILVIVCANVANLLLARAGTRQKELSVRASLGATRARLMRQLLTEAVLLAAVGAAAGVLVASWARALLPGTASQGPLDWRVLAFAGGVALLTGIVFGIAPAVRATTSSVNTALKEHSRNVIGSRSIVAKTLLVVQVAVSLLLLVGAGLFLRTMANLRQVDLGFNPRNLVVFRVNPQLSGYDAPRTASLYNQIVARLQAAPGVRSVTLSAPLLLSGGVNSTTFIVEGRPYNRTADNEVHRMRIAHDFFGAMEIPLLTGRSFSARDDQAGSKVAVINEAAARKFFANENPLGRRFGSSPEASGQIEIVGVVRDVRYNSVRDDPPPTMYVPYTQNPVGAMGVAIRTAGDPAAMIASIRAAVREVDSSVPLMAVSTQLEQIENRIAQERIFAQAYTLFGGLALVVAAIGLFGLMSYSVTKRTSEIGIRMALGAERRTVVGMIMRESLVLVVAGIAVGIAAAVGTGRLIAALLFGVAPIDAGTFAMATLVMTAVSLFAGYWPARRAARIDPIVALHDD
jgi:predicted permease